MDGFLPALEFAVEGVVITPAGELPTISITSWCSVPLSTGERISSADSPMFLHSACYNNNVLESNRRVNANFTDDPEHLITDHGVLWL
jgi:hypothetical protein